MKYYKIRRNITKPKAGRFVSINRLITATNPENDSWGVNFKKNNGKVKIAPENPNQFFGVFEIKDSKNIILKIKCSNYDLVKLLIQDAGNMICILPDNEFDKMDKSHVSNLEKFIPVSKILHDGVLKINISEICPDFKGMEIEAGKVGFRIDPFISIDEQTANPEEVSYYIEDIKIWEE